MPGIGSSVENDGDIILFHIYWSHPKRRIHMATKQDKPETIKMVETTMGVLNLLRSSNTPLGVNAIAKQCSLNPSTTYRILKSLEKTGWVYQFEDDRYITGQKISFVTNQNNFFLALSDAAKCTMEKCTAHNGLAMNLIVRNGADCVIIQQSLTKSIVNYVPPLNSVLPFYACGGGKVLLCELPEVIIDQILDTYEMVALTPFTITNPDKFREELKKTNENGYAIDFQESTINGSCIAVPIRDSNKAIIASLSFSGLIGISSPDKLLNYLPALKEASEKITDTLYRAWKK